MAYTFDAKTTSNATSTGLTVSHTTAVGVNLLVCGIGIRGTQTITSITYGGVALSLGRYDPGPAGDLEGAAIYYLVSPASGANNLIVALSGSVLHFVSISTYTGDAGTPSLDVTASTSNTGTSTAPATAVSGAVGTLGVDVASSESNTANPWTSAGGDQTVLHNVGTGSYGIGSSYELNPAAAEQFDWSPADTSTWVQVVAIFKEGATQTVLPDADTTTTGWTTTPLWSKVNDASDATIIQATLA